MMSLIGKSPTQPTTTLTLIAINGTMTSTSTKGTLIEENVRQILKLSVCFIKTLAPRCESARLLLLRSKCHYRVSPRYRSRDVHLDA